MTPDDPTPPTLLKIPPGMIVASLGSNKSRGIGPVPPPSIIIYPKNMAFWAVLGASVNGSLSFAFIAFNKVVYLSLP